MLLYDDQFSVRGRDVQIIFLLLMKLSRNTGNYEVNVT